MWITAGGVRCSGYGGAVHASPRRSVGLRRVLAVAALVSVLGAGCLTGCTSPTPAPTPTGFATAEEAFAAAEATYRAYVDALNQVDLADPATFEEVYSWTTGDANASERKSLSQMHADGWTVSGASRVLEVLPDETMASKVSAVACVDVSDTQVADAEGKSMVAADRPRGFALLLTFQPQPSSPYGLQIVSSTAIEDLRCDFG